MKTGFPVNAYKNMGISRSTNSARFTVLLLPLSFSLLYLENLNLSFCYYAVRARFLLLYIYMYIYVFLMYMGTSDSHVNIYSFRRNNKFDIRFLPQCVM